MKTNISNSIISYQYVLAGLEIKKTENLSIIHIIKIAFD